MSAVAGSTWCANKSSAKVHDQFGMQAAKCLGHVAIPANRTVGRKHVGELLRPQLSPLDRSMVGIKQRRRVIQMAKFAERFAAEDAILSFIQIRDDIPNQAFLGTHFDLLQAFLAAILPLRPARTFFQA